MNTFTMNRNAMTDAMIVRVVDAMAHMTKLSLTSQAHPERIIYRRAAEDMSTLLQYGNKLVAVRDNKPVVVQTTRMLFDELDAEGPCSWWVVSEKNTKATWIGDTSSGRVNCGAALSHLVS